MGRLIKREARRFSLTSYVLAYAPSSLTRPCSLLSRPCSSVPGVLLGGNTYEYSPSAYDASKKLALAESAEHRAKTGDRKPVSHKYIPSLPWIHQI